MINIVYRFMWIFLLSIATYVLHIGLLFPVDYLSNKIYGLNKFVGDVLFVVDGPLSLFMAYFFSGFILRFMKVNLKWVVTFATISTAVVFGLFSIEIYIDSILLEVRKVAMYFMPSIGIFSGWLLKARPSKWGQIEPPPV